MGKFWTLCFVRADLRACAQHAQKFPHSSIAVTSLQDITLPWHVLMPHEEEALKQAPSGHLITKPHARQRGKQTHYHMYYCRSILQKW